MILFLNIAVKENRKEKGALPFNTKVLSFIRDKTLHCLNGDYDF